MNHKFSPGQTVYYAVRLQSSAAQGIYKILCRLPIGNDDRLSYRIKSAAEPFERIAEEHQLTTLNGC